MIYAQRAQIDLTLLLHVVGARSGDVRDRVTSAQVFDAVSSSPFLPPAELASRFIGLAPKSFSPFWPVHLSCLGSDILGAQRFPRRAIRVG